MTLTLPERPRTGHAERNKRTVVSVDVRDIGSWDHAVGCTVAFLSQADALFAIEDRDSQISRIRAGKLSIDEADPRMQEVLQLCAEVEAETDGYFSTHWHDLFDPTGLIKGWAAGRASQMLRGYGSYNHAVSVGSDIRLLGEPLPGRPWSIGISDPLHPTRLLTTVGGRDFAVATSAPDRHGLRIINPHTWTVASALRSATVIGPDSARADGYSTAAFAMGHDALPWVESLTGYEALVVTANGRSRWTSGFPSAIGVR